MRIIPLYLIISIFATILILYLKYPSPQVVLVSPNITDESEVYKDKGGVCYRYHKKLVDCHRKNRT